MYKELDEDIIEREIMTIIPGTSRGFLLTVLLHEIVNAILYKLKTGVQCEKLHVSSLLEKVAQSWQSVYPHYSE